MPLSASTLGPLGAMALLCPWMVLGGDGEGQELLSLLAGCADGASYGISLGWDQQEALGLLNVPGTH